MLQQDALNSITNAIADEIFPLLRTIHEREAEKHGGGDKDTETAIGQTLIDLTASALTWSLCLNEKPPEQPNLSPAELTPEDARKAVGEAIEGMESWEKWEANHEARYAETPTMVGVDIETPDVSEVTDTAPEAGSLTPSQKAEQRISELLATKVVPTVYKAIQEVATDIAEDDIFYGDTIANTAILELVEYLTLCPLNTEYPFYTPIHMARLGNPKWAAEWFGVEAVS